MPAFCAQAALAPKGACVTLVIMLLFTSTSQCIGLLDLTFVCDQIAIHLLRQLQVLVSTSLTLPVPEPQHSLSDSEVEIDFGFWEKG